MLFTTIEFIALFLPLTMAGFFLLGRINRLYAAAWLALASLVFYGWWNPAFVALLFCSITFNFLLGARLSKTQKDAKGKALLTFAVGSNLAVLALFKYANFFLGTASDLIGVDVAMADIVLPLGISFFTFTQIAFLVDARRGIAKEYNFIHYSLFVTYFPHLIAGPVLHHKQMMPQFGLPETYAPRIDNLSIGLVIFSVGLAKKVLLADSFAPYASPVFDAAHAGHMPTAEEAWVGALAYTFQIYFDFSGYSDMAIGLSRLFGVQLPFNFDSPYRAPNIIEFWRRWHMTLSQFLRDYLYVPLGGNRHGLFNRYRNLMITMLLGGLWHGANWTFVAWGGLHGAYLIVNHGWQMLRSRIGLDGLRVPGARFAGTLLTFLVVVVAWVYFRAESFAAANRILEAMFIPGTLGDATLHELYYLHYFQERFVALLVVGGAIVALPNNSNRLNDTLAHLPTNRLLLMAGLAFSVVAMLITINAARGTSEFIYFNF